MGKVLKFSYECILKNKCMIYYMYIVYTTYSVCVCIYTLYVYRNSMAVPVAFKVYLYKVDKVYICCNTD